MKQISAMLKRLVTEEAGQTATEYVLGVSFICIAMASAFLYMQDSTRGIFNNARMNIELPYP